MKAGIFSRRGFLRGALPRNVEGAHEVRWKGNTVVVRRQQPGTIIFQAENQETR